MIWGQNRAPVFRINISLAFLQPGIQVLYGLNNVPCGSFPLCFRSWLYCPRFTGAEVFVLPLAPCVWSAAVFWPGDGWAERESGGSGPGRWSCGALVLAATGGTGSEGRTAGSARGTAAGRYRWRRAPPTLWSWRSLVEGHEEIQVS